ncbi:MAG: hypothetical protein GC160_02855 [Acidobacteria bacterium]|nr:hypothetical protein [Acidobacteriota bacterium]
MTDTALLLGLARESVGGVLALLMLLMVWRWLPRFHAAFEQHNANSQRMAEAVEMSAEAVKQSVQAAQQTAETSDSVLIAVRAMGVETDSQGKRLARMENLLAETLRRMPSGEEEA